jgi:hypothetical protein
LSKIPEGKIVPHVAVANTPQHPIQDEDDEHILALFRDVNLEEYLTSLQVFWYIGCVDRAAMQSAGPAMGVKKLTAMRESLKPNFRHYELPWNVAYFSETLYKKLDFLFGRPPFASHAWPEAEREQLLRKDFERKSRHNTRGKGRDEKQWTTKAWRAWKYINRFLIIKGLLPQLDDDFD